MNTLESTIGNTPLAKIQRLTSKGDGQIFLKLEGNNPAGSVKDRPAYSMIHHAELRGDIKPEIPSLKLLLETLELHWQW